ncbi:MAG: FixH family protein [Bacteroidetes bacterium]|nr:FixH family protein [Bacteroidota bacterium]
MRKILFTALMALLFYSCSKDNSVNSVNNPVNSDYIKLFSVDTTGVRYEVYSRTGSSFFVGYNEIGLKVFINDAEQKTGYVNFTPVMYHAVGPGHGTPVSPKFYYSDSTGLFTGYVSYIMLSDTTSRWFGDYGYNGGNFVRHKEFSVIPGTGNQMHFWLGEGSSLLYLLTVVAPKNASIGLNDYKCILHSTADQYIYNEVDSAKMFIKSWMPSHGHGSSSNVNPFSLGNGMYKGVANFTMAGQWYLYDSITVNGSFITPNPTFYFVFDVQ